MWASAFVKREIPMANKPMKVRAGAEAANRTAAAVILENPARYGGEEAGLVRWARLVVEQSKSATGRAA